MYNFEKLWIHVLFVLILAVSMFFMFGSIIFSNSSKLPIAMVEEKPLLHEAIQFESDDVGNFINYLKTSSEIVIESYTNSDGGVPYLEIKDSSGTTHILKIGDWLISVENGITVVPNSKFEERYKIKTITYK